MSGYLMDDTYQRPHHSHGPAVTGLLVFAVCLAAQRADIMAGAFGLDGLNLSSARGIADGVGWRWPHLVGVPPSAATQPLAPVVAIIATLLWRATPDNILLVQLLNAACLGVAAWATARVVTRWPVPAWMGHVGTVAGYLTVPMVALTRSAFAVPFAALLLAGLMVTMDGAGQSRGRAAVAGALAALMGLTVGPALILIPAVALILGRRGNTRVAVAASVAAMVVLAPWIPIMFRGLPAGVEASRLAATGQEVQSGWYMVTGVVGALVPTLRGVLRVVAGAVIWLAAVWAAWTLRRVFAGWLLLLVLALAAAAWPLPQRSWSTLLVPWVAPLVVVGLWRLWGANRLTRIPVGILSVSLLVVFAVPTVTGLVRRTGSELPVDGDSLERWLMSIDNELPPGAVVASDRDGLVYLHTGRRTVAAPVAGSLGPETVRSWCAAGASHVAASGLVPGFSTGLLGLAADSTIDPLFRLTDGPALYRLPCPD